MKQEFDVVVVGSGIAGVASALFAANRGAKTVLIEKAPKLGGITSSNSGGVTWIAQNHLFEETSPAEPDSAADALTYLRFVGGGRQDEDKAAAYATYGRDALREAVNSSIGYHLVPQYVDLYSPGAPGSRKGGRVVEVDPFPMDSLGDTKPLIAEGKRSRLRPPGATQRDLLGWKSRTDPRGWDMEAIRARNRDGDRCSFGYGLIGAFVHALLEREVTIWPSTAMRDLVVGPGERVTGVLIDGPDGPGELTARHGVVLASGGYESNPALVWLLEELREWKSPAPRGHTGDALTCATRHGAAVRRITPNITIMFGFPSADPDVNFVSAGNSDLCLPHSLVVDQTGRRFGDESFFQDMSAQISAFDAKKHAFIHRGGYLIFDQQYLRKFGFRGCREPGELPEWVVAASSIEGIAGHFGLDAAQLEATVARFNKAAVDGTDGEYGRGSGLWSSTIGAVDSELANPNLGPVDQSPFYGVKLEMGGTASAGLLTDPSARVLRWNGAPVEGLYAVGTAAAHTEFGIGYQAGFQLGGALTFGYQAARAMAAT